MATVNEKMTGLANAVRAKSGGTAELSIDGMTTTLNNIPNRTSSDLTVSGATVTAPMGNYKAAASITVTSGSAATPETTITANPSLATTITSGRGYKMSVSKTQSVTPTVSAGYVNSGTAGNITVSGEDYVAESTTGDAASSNTATATKTIGAGQQITIGAGYYPSARIIRNSIIGTEEKTTTPTTSPQTITPSSGKLISKITVNKIPDQYVDTSNATATELDIREGCTAGINGAMVEGTLSTLTPEGTPILFDIHDTTFEEVRGIEWDENLEAHLFSVYNVSFDTPVNKYEGEVISAGEVITNNIGLKIYHDDIGTASESKVLSGYTFSAANGFALIGNMSDNGAVTQALNAGGSYTIPEGYHNGNGTVTANSLASQTPGTAAAGDILSNKKAWVNGSEVTGSIQTKTEANLAVNGSTVTIPAGYYASAITKTVESTPTLNTWPVTLTCQGYGSTTTYTISYMNSAGVFTSTTCAKGSKVVINVAENSLVKVSCSNGLDVYTTNTPSVAECRIVNNASTEFGLWFGSSASRPAIAFGLYDSSRTCTVKVDTLDGYGSVGVSYVNSSGTRVSVTVSNNATQSFTVLCGSEIRLIDQSGDGLYFSGINYWTPVYTAEVQTDAYMVPTYPSQTYSISMSRD